MPRIPLSNTCQENRRRQSPTGNRSAKPPRAFPLPCRAALRGLLAAPDSVREYHPLNRCQGLHKRVRGGGIFRCVLTARALRIKLKMGSSHPAPRKAAKKLSIGFGKTLLRGFFGIKCEGKSLPCQNQDIVLAAGQHRGTAMIIHTTRRLFPSEALNHDRTLTKMKQLARCHCALTCSFTVCRNQTWLFWFRAIEQNPFPT